MEVAAAYWKARSLKRGDRKEMPEGSELIPPSSISWRDMMSEARVQLERALAKTKEQTAVTQHEACHAD